MGDYRTQHQRLFTPVQVCHCSMGFLPESFGQKFQAYFVLEFLIWLPGVYAVCYRFQPSVRMVQTRWGSQLVQGMSSALQKYTPSWHSSIAKLSSRVYGSPNGRATAEWLLVNKVLAPVSFPTKLWLAHRIVEKRAATTLELSPSTQVKSG